MSVTRKLHGTYGVFKGRKGDLVKFDWGTGSKRSTELEWMKEIMARVKKHMWVEHREHKKEDYFSGSCIHVSEGRTGSNVMTLEGYSEMADNTERYNYVTLDRVLKLCQPNPLQVTLILAQLKNTHFVRDIFFANKMENKSLY